MWQVWLKSLDIYTSYHPETKILACLGQITLSKFDKIFPLAILNQIYAVSMHIQSLVKILWCLFKLSSGNENMGMSRADNSINIWWNICPLAIPNQISTISMHIPSLVKIHWRLLKLSSGKEIRTDALQMTDGQTHGRPTWNHNTLPLLCVCVCVCVGGGGGGGGG